MLMWCCFTWWLVKTPDYHKKTVFKNFQASKSPSSGAHLWVGFLVPLRHGHLAVSEDSKFIAVRNVR